MTMGQEENKKAERSNELFQRSAALFAKSIAPAVKKAAEAMDVFGEKIYEIAKKEYLKHHRKLPGGQNSTRLSKKRRAIVMGWFINRAAH